MNDVVIIGLGQLGGVFAHGLLRTGARVTPVRRSDDMHVIADEVPSPLAVLVAVGEGDLQAVLEAMPAPWASRVVLLQNELLPPSWNTLKHSPTVAVVWFEKKKPIAAHPIQSTPIAGPNAARFVDALMALDLPAHVIEDDALCEALVVKNVYILTANIAGLSLSEGATTGGLASAEGELFERVALEALSLQRATLRASGVPFDASDESILDAVRAAMMADADHKLRGRSAPARLARALEDAKRFEIEVPEMQRIANSN